MKVKDIENKYNIKLNADPNMKLTEFLKKEGFPNMAKLVENRPYHDLSC